jgi:hypothetical protein
VDVSRHSLLFNDKPIAPLTAITRKLYYSVISTTSSTVGVSTLADDFFAFKSPNFLIDESVTKGIV